MRKYFYVMISMALPFSFLFVCFINQTDVSFAEERGSSQADAPVTFKGSADLWGKSAGKSAVSNEGEKQQCLLHYHRERLDRALQYVKNSSNINGEIPSQVRIAIATLYMSGDYAPLDKLIPLSQPYDAICGNTKRVEPKCEEVGPCFDFSSLTSPNLNKKISKEEFINVPGALDFLKDIDEKKYPEASLLLGCIYIAGEGVPKDLAIAQTHLINAAKNGNVEAQNLLGHLFSGDEFLITMLPLHSYKGIKKDYVYAYMWYNVAGSKGSSSATQFRDALEKKMKPEEISLAQSLSTKCLQSNFQSCGDNQNAITDSLWRYWK